MLGGWGGGVGGFPFGVYLIVVQFSRRVVDPAVRQAQSCHPAGMELAMLWKVTL